MSHDAIVLGGGADGLVCATVLARAGLSVLVLEAGEAAGGAVVTEEVGGEAGGVRVPALWPSAEAFAPAIRDDLGLDAHGLELLASRGPASVATPEGLVPLTEGALEARSAGDGRALGQLREFLRRLDRSLGPLLRAPLPDVDDPGARDGLALLAAAWRLRRLGRNGMYEALRFLPMPVRDVVRDRFADPVARAGVAGRALAGSPLGPWGPGTAVGLLWHALPWVGGVVDGLGAPRFVRGGAGALSRALTAAARAAGAEVRTGGVRVERIRVRDGRVAGVTLTDGEEIEATTVASTLQPAATLLELLEPGWLEPEETAAVSGVRNRGSVATVAFVLEALPQVAAAGHGAGEGRAGAGGAGQEGRAGRGDETLLSGRIQVGASLEALERAADDAKHGRLPRQPVLDLTFPSVADGSLVPEGRHVAHAWVHHVPLDPKPMARGPEAGTGGVAAGGAGGTGEAGARETRRGVARETGRDVARGTGRDGARYPGAEGSRQIAPDGDTLGDAVVGAIEEVLPGFAERLVERRVLMPADLERRYGVAGGAPYQVDMTLDQMLFLRPFRRASGHRTPVPGLYLCGPGTHPGGGLTGLPGRNGARRILTDRRGRR